MLVNSFFLLTLILGALCTGEKGTGLSGKALWYKGSGFHRVIKGWVLTELVESMYKYRADLCVKEVTSLLEMVPPILRFQIDLSLYISIDLFDRNGRWIYIWWEVWRWSFPCEPYEALFTVHGIHYICCSLGQSVLNAESLTGQCGPWYKRIPILHHCGTNISPW